MRRIFGFTSDVRGPRAVPYHQTARMLASRVVPADRMGIAHAAPEQCLINFNDDSTSGRRVVHAITRSIELLKRD